MSIYGHPEYPSNLPEGAPPAPCYQGIVVDNKDPEKRGRIRVRCPQLYGTPSEEESIPDDQLPWALPAFPFGSAGTGSLMVPEAGTGVYLMFIGGRPSSPVWFGSWLTEDDSADEFKSGYDPEPKSYLIKTPAGNKIELRETANEVHIDIETSGGHRVHIDDSGQKIQAETSGGHIALFDDANQAIEFTSSGGHVIRMDDLLQKAEIKTTGGHTILMDDLAQSIQMMNSSGPFMLLDGLAQMATLDAAGGVNINSSGGNIQIGAPAGNIVMTAGIATTFVSAAQAIPTVMSMDANGVNMVAQTSALSLTPTSVQLNATTAPIIMNGLATTINSSGLLSLNAGGSMTLAAPSGTITGTDSTGPVIP